MWERTLQDLIRGLRANKNDESKFISQAIDEIRKEVRGKDMELKAGAILKMTFLDMLGYDLAWADFNIIEVMSSPKYHLKTVGYLGASQSFNQHTDVLMLATNLLKKDLSSNPGDTALALNGLSTFVTPDLARDLTQELNAMLNHSRANIRKRVVLALLKVINQNPESLQYCLPRLKEKLEDPDSSVVSATVNLFCELARKTPQDFLILAPPLFHILTTSSNNWMLIKVIKLFGAISPYEPRLVRKLQAPITELIQTTPAISLLYECVRTCIIGGMLDGYNGLPLARLCVTKLSAFLENDDQNLKYIALMAMVKIVPVHPDLVAEHQAVILASLDDFDISIRMRALELVSSMVNVRNAQFLVQQLLSHLVKADEATSLPSALGALSSVLQSSETTENSSSTAPVLTTAYRLEVANRILDMCSRNMYENVQDFDWYLSVLLDLIYVANADVAAPIRDQLVDVTVRVRACRNYAAKLMTKLLDDDGLVLGASDPERCTGVLWAAAWICGEYADELDNPQHVLTRLVQPSISHLPPDIIAVYLQSTLKVFSYWAYDLVGHWDDGQLSRVETTVTAILDAIASFASHPDIEVQERAANAIQLFSLVKGDLDLYQPQPLVTVADTSEFENVFEEPSAPKEVAFPKGLLLLRRFFTAYPLRPVALNAQQEVKMPEGLDLDAWIVAPKHTVHDDDHALERGKKKKRKGGKDKENGHTRSKRTDGQHTEGVQVEEDEAELIAKRAERLARQRDDPYYITDRPSKPLASTSHQIDTIPIIRLDDLPSISALTPPRSSSRLSDVAPSPSPKVFQVDRTGENPNSNQASRSVTPLPDEPSRSQSTNTSLPSGLHTPEVIVVRRSKKKATSKSKASSSAL